MAQPRYSFEDDVGEQQPLGASNSPLRYEQDYRQQYQPQQPYYQHDPYTNSPPRGRQGGHPESAFDNLRAQRRLSQDRPPGQGNGGWAPGPYVSTAPPANIPGPQEPEPPIYAPQPPPHRGARGQYGAHEYPPQQFAAPKSNTTPGADNFSEAAVGGMAGIAMTVAEQNARDSGLEAVQNPNYPQQIYQQQGLRQTQGQGYNEHGVRGVGGADLSQPRMPYGHVLGGDTDSHASLQGLNNVAPGPGYATPGYRTPSRSPHRFTNDIYTDDPYQNFARPQDPRLGIVNPHEIEDDGDDGLSYARRNPRTSMLSLGGSSHRSRDPSTAPGTAAGTAAAGGGVIAGLVGKNGSGSLNGYYAPVYNGAVDGPDGTGSAGHSSFGVEKAGWQSAPAPKRNPKRWRIMVIAGFCLLIAAGIVLGILFGVVFNKNKTGGSATGASAASDTQQNGDLDLNSAQIQALMNNANLHKVFPGVDYTPVNTQYPDCLSNPPSQNNVTRDIAVLSQLTNTVRLYGTDCNQTQMVIHALKQLKMEDTIKIWLGVWQDNNVTTNARQLAQMWDILDMYGEKPFKGLIVANEILFREQMTITELGTLLSSVRTNLTAKGMSLPVATSDLGDKWTAELAQQSDYIMANIHPFFGGINAKDAASWTWSFWDNHNSGFFKADKSKNIISETGWPTQGGMDCGVASVTECPDASVAGIQQVNQFMADWVCSALTNGTNYFWFEAFDEPWKIRFNTDKQQWEDHWGLIDVDRNLKDGIKIPDCGGKTV
ncbi:glycoside hydrolase family 17 protein [Cercophora scortea]|uniref:glucan endo-1,3-beta-D-glucosidase n=1 Tax=Cercophora scortea TaxID=314031 RepID=A0AAE0J4D0_9PEZI|nr:glycoside hydrolase family 17 protein [Cercophora scortea]